MTRPKRTRWPAAAALALAAVPLVFSACGSSSPGTATAGSGRPHTNAQLAILEPTPNAVTGPDVTIVLSLVGAHIVPSTSPDVRPDEGHIHLYVDSKLVSMYYKLTEAITGLRPGLHSVRAEFVGSDHLPFANRVVASVVFTVRG